ncbi:MAG: glycosyltransferase [Cyanobacteria bacterium J083]|nr:MAG: glycosyltransferase [Cyanobacteria bacterium J083]
MNSLNILISAYACRPNQGSEPGVGWNTVNEIAKYHRVWVLTRSDNRPAIASLNQDNANGNLHFIYCEPSPWLKWWWKSTQIPHYYLWQLAAYLTARKLHQQINFALVHHITYVRYSTPSFLSLLPIPFLWGPVGGGETTPPSFWQDFSWRGKVYEILRSLVHQIGERDPFTRLTASRSVLTRATTKDTATRLESMGASQVQICSESGLSQQEIEFLGLLPLPPDHSIRLISLARLLHWKGLHLSIRAFAQANFSANVEYWILGEGAEQERLENLTRQLKIEQQVKFWGRLSREETLNKLGDCHVLVHPSLHDSGGWVCLEAMAAGRPVICLNTGGPGMQVTEETGYKIPAINPTQTIEELAQAMKYLAEDRKLRDRLGKAAKKRVKAHFTWELKGKQLAQLYNEIISS